MASDASVNRMAKNISAKLSKNATPSTLPGKDAIRKKATPASTPSKSAVRKKAQ